MDLKRVVARTTLRSGTGPQGTAFLVDRSLAVTCAHCLGQRGARSDQLVLDFSRSNGGKVDGDVILVDEELDVALLRLCGEVDASPAVLAENARQDARWHSFSYPAPSGEDGLTLSGRVVDVEARAYGKPVIQLHCDQSVSDVAGASGGPVVVHGMVVGMLTKQLLGYGDGGVVRPVFQTVYALPLSEVKSLASDHGFHLSPPLQKKTLLFQRPVRALVLHAFADEASADELVRRLEQAEEAGPIAAMHRCVIGPETATDIRLSEVIEQANIIAVIVSSSLLTLPLYEQELRQSIARAGGPLLVGVVIDDCSLEGSPFACISHRYRTIDLSWSQIAERVGGLAHELRGDSIDPPTVKLRRRRGEVINDNYKLLGRLGEGGFGEVWRARQRSLHRDVAIKFLKAEHSSPAMRKRFEREAEATCRVAHDNVVDIYDFLAPDDDTLAIVMEFLDGAPLSAILDEKEDGKLPVAELCTMMIQVIDAIRAAHDSGVVHRDLKPANIFRVATSGQMKVLDFGLAKLTSTSCHSSRTSAGTIMGTLPYMSPEQIATPTDVDGRADVFALGVILYRALQGRLPISATGPVERVRAIEKRRYDPLDEDLPRELRDMVGRMMSPIPSDRPSLAVVVAALQRLATAPDEPPLQNQGSAPEQAPPAQDAAARGTKPDQPGDEPNNRRIPVWVQIAGGLLVSIIAAAATVFKCYEGHRPRPGPDVVIREATTGIAGPAPHAVLPLSFTMTLRVPGPCEGRSLTIAYGPWQFASETLQATGDRCSAELEHLPWWLRGKQAKANMRDGGNCARLVKPSLVLSDATIDLEVIRTCMTLRVHSCPGGTSLSVQEGNWRTTGSLLPSSRGACHAKFENLPAERSGRLVDVAMTPSPQCQYLQPSRVKLGDDAELKLVGGICRCVRHAAGIPDEYVVCRSKGKSCSEVCQ